MAAGGSPVTGRDAYDDATPLLPRSAGVAVEALPASEAPARDAGDGAAKASPACSAAGPPPAPAVSSRVDWIGTAGVVLALGVACLAGGAGLAGPEAADDRPEHRATMEAASAEVRAVPVAARSEPVAARPEPVAAFTVGARAGAPRGGHTARARAGRAAAVPSDGGASRQADRPPDGADPRSPDAAIRGALVRYVEGDVEGARAILAPHDGAAAAAAVAATLEGILAHLGTDGTWPPPGGAASLERVLELEARLGLSGDSRLAARVRVTLAGLLLERARALGDLGRWDASADAARQALVHEPDSTEARASLDRVEAAALAYYLEGYALEEVDPTAARRLYGRALRLAAPGGSVASRAARALQTAGR
jgi:hypothetical protein